MATYNYLDNNGLLYYHQKLKTSIANGYVAKESGKGLSTNDFTNALKTKLDGIATGAEVNVQSDWSQTTTTADDYIKNKPVNVSAFTNDSGYQTSAQVQSAINSAISGITGIEFEIVTSLPTTGRTGTIYLLSHGGTSPEIYDEYIWLSSSSSYEKIGTTDVDLSGYVQASEMVAITNAEIDTILAS